MNHITKPAHSGLLVQVSKINGQTPNRKKNPITNEQNQPTPQSTNFTAGRDIEIAVGRDFIGRDKLTTTYHYDGLTVEQVAEFVVQLKTQDQPTVWNGRIPYPGLSAFQENDAKFFFGRETLIDEVLKQVQESNFILPQFAA